MRFFEVQDRSRVGTVMTQCIVRLLAAVSLTACPAKTDPPKETAPSTSIVATQSPSAAASSAPEAPVASASASAITPVPAPILSSIDPETVTALLVWQKDDKARGGYRTQWVERDGDKPKVIGERPGILFMSSVSLWTLETTIVKGCPQNPQLVKIKPDAEEYRLTHSRPDMEMPEMTRISDGKRVTPWKDGHGYPYMGVQCDPAIEEYSVSVTFVGGMGPFIVVRLGSYTFSGGAHGIRSEEFLTINLETMDTVKLLPKEIDRAALAANAAKGMGVEPKDVNPNGTLLLYGPNGAGLAIYRYWTSAVYAAGNGGNSYSSDFEVSSKGLPPEVAGYGKLPAWASPVLKPKSIPVFMVPADQKERFKAQFDAAYAKTK